MAFQDPFQRLDTLEAGIHQWIRAAALRQALHKVLEFGTLLLRSKASWRDVGAVVVLYGVDDDFHLRVPDEVPVAPDDGLHATVQGEILDEAVQEVAQIAVEGRPRLEEGVEAEHGGKNEHG